jgi:hypothetical protein
MAGPQQIDSVAGSRGGADGKGHHDIHLTALGVSLGIHGDTAANGGAIADGNVQHGLVGIGHSLLVHFYP